MKEDVGLEGNALNYLNVAYCKHASTWRLTLLARQLTSLPLADTAYVVGQIPMVALQSRPSLAPYFLPGLEVVWAILTFAQSRASKPWHLYLLRALVGFAEAPSCESSACPAGAPVARFG